MDESAAQSPPEQQVSIEFIYLFAQRMKVITSEDRNDVHYSEMSKFAQKKIRSGLRFNIFFSDF